MTMRKILALSAVLATMAAAMAGVAFGQAAPAAPAAQAAPAAKTAPAAKAAPAAKPAQAASPAMTEKALALKKEMGELVFKIKKYNNSMVDYIMQYRQKGSLSQAMMGDLSNMSKDTATALKRFDQILADPAFKTVATPPEMAKFKGFKTQAEKTIKDAQPILGGKK